MIFSLGLIKTFLLISAADWSSCLLLDKAWRKGIKKKELKKEMALGGCWVWFSLRYFLCFGKTLCSSRGLGSERREGWSITLMDNGWKAGHWLLKPHVWGIKVISPSQDTPVAQIITDEFLHPNLAFPRRKLLSYINHCTVQSCLCFKIQDFS